MTGNTGKRHSMAGWVWGFLLILAGALFLAINLNLVSLEGPMILFLVAGGVALLAVPLLIAWLINREQWWTLIPAWIFLSLAVLLVVSRLEFPYSQAIPLIVLVQIAVPFFVAYLANRQNRWTLIPAYAALALAALAALTILRTPEEMLAGIALIFIALPFWWAYMRDRGRWWALIPAGGMSAVALPLMFFSSQRLSGREEFILYTGLLTALFIVVWITNRRLDWALWIAGGFIISIALTFIRPEFRQSWPVVLLALGAHVVSRQLFGRRPGKTAPTPPPPAAQASQPPSEAALPSSEKPPEPTPPRSVEGVTFRRLDIPPDEPPKD
jgi:drug/metabolite transporter (DMT)-like permease